MWTKTYTAVGFAILSLGAQAQVTDRFRLYEPDSLDVSLGSACISALSGQIRCHEYVQAFTELTYRQSLGDVAITDEVCDPSCNASLRSWFNRVNLSCAGKTVYDSLPNKLGGYIWAGWNETCLRDPKTGEYCNDVMDGFSAVDSISDMPRDELCHACHGRRIALMQSSQYSTYDEFWQSQLEYIYETCDGNGPTEIPEPLETVTPEPAPYCVSNKRYTTNVGDTCESIANATGVSAANLYMGNQEILPDCQELEPGVTVCLPLPCRTYYLKPTDTCTKVEVAHELDMGSLRSFNSWINAYCTNIHEATNFYGKVICISPQGGQFTETPPDSVPTSAPAPSDGYTNSPITPPENATVADGTTLNCGKWHKVVGEDTCTTICVRNGITTKLFHEVNPSLGAGQECSATLEVGTALCVGPTYDWDSETE